MRTPTWQSLQILPASYASKLEEVKQFMLEHMEDPKYPFRGFKDYEVARLDRDIAWMRSAQDRDHSQDRADFYRFFAEHDHRRDTDFLKTFPEMKSWWEECRYHAR